MLSPIFFIAGSATAMSRIDSIVCVTGEEEPETLQRCQTLYRGFRQFMSAHAGIGVSGVCGRPVPDVQELGQSFEEALAHLSPLMPDALALAPVQDGTDTPGGRQVVERTIRRIWSVYSDANEPALHEALEAYAGAAGSGASGPVLRYGLYLLTRMCGMMPAARILQKERAVNALVGALAEPQRKQDARSIAGLYARMLQTLDTEAADPEESASDPQHLARRAREYVLDHFAEPISLSLVADHLEVSPGHLGKLFQEQLHESYIKFLTRIRMEQAEHLLRHAETPIQTVAARTGYVNQKHFCHVFKQYHGMTAGEWQRRNVSPGAFPSP